MTQETEQRQSQPKRNAIPILSIDVAILRFLVIVVLSWVFYYAAMSANPKWTVETYIPWSFWLLHYLLIIGVIGGGWPLVAPAGGSFFQQHWGGHGRLVLGLLMTGLAVGMAAALSGFFTNVWWGYPLFPGGAWYGIGLFWITLWWVLNIQISPHPVIPPQKFHPVLNMAMSSAICIFLAVAVFQFVDYDVPFNGDSSNPEGPASASWWFGCVVSIIVWVHNWNQIMTFQRWPFSLIGNPYLQHVTMTVTTVLLGWAVYEIVIAAGVDKTFYADAVGASQISCSLYHTIAFDFWPFHRMAQPKRGFYAFCFSQVVLPFFWSFLCRIILQPIYDLMVEANPIYGAIFTLNTMIPWFSLHVVAPLLLVHHSFFMRWPLPPAGPPLGPADVGVVQDLLGEDGEHETLDNSSSLQDEREQLVGGKSEAADDTNNATDLNAAAVLLGSNELDDEHHV
mmetsp:Transcript_16796/g.46136  ORF Transcript_16796/g.46136 Transcript_16796/m.46136 type:complete len:452 (+) Transcript_16796:237-1592(+)